MRSQSSLAADQDRLQECVGEMQSLQGKQESPWASARECAKPRVELNRAELSRNKNIKRNPEVEEKRGPQINHFFNLI